MSPSEKLQALQADVDLFVGATTPLHRPQAHGTRIDPLSPLAACVADALGKLLIGHVRGRMPEVGPIPQPPGTAGFSPYVLPIA